MSKPLRGRNAVVYGAGGGIGGAVAAFLASDRAAGITGTMTNVTCGLVLK